MQYCISISGDIEIYTMLLRLSIGLKCSGKWDLYNHCNWQIKSCDSTMSMQRLVSLSMLLKEFCSRLSGQAQLSIALIIIMYIVSIKKTS